MRCDFIVLCKKGERYKHRCVRCGRVIGWTTTRMNPYATCRVRGLGDWVEAFIRAIGIRPKCGGCQERKDRLNEFDRRVYRLLRGPKNGETYST